MRRVRIVLLGLGNLGRRFCEIVMDKRSTVADRYGLDLRLVGAADSRGVAYAPEGLDLARIVDIKQRGDSIAVYPELGRSDWEARALVAAADADVLLDASPVNLQLGAEPGLSCIRAAIMKGWHVVTPNKGPLVLQFSELHALATRYGVALRYDGTVAGGLPALNLGCRDLRGAMVHSLEAVPNLVTGYIMDMLVDGVPWEDATALARDEGVLEADADWDIDGWDAAAKLVILANAVLGCNASLEHVNREGIRSLADAELRAAQGRGGRYRLLAIAKRRDDGSYELSVKPTALQPSHPLGRLGRKQMGVVFRTDIYGTITSIIDEPNPVPSSATMLRDLLDIYVASHLSTQS